MRCDALKGSSLVGVGVENLDCTNKVDCERYCRCGTYVRYNRQDASTMTRIMSTNGLQISLEAPAAGT